jgi:hypothetical protein
VSKVSRFGVAFVGYTANIFGLKNGREIEYATLDFVSGCAILKADGGRAKTCGLVGVCR